MDVSLPLAFPFSAHNSWPDFSPLLVVVGLSLMTIHREGTLLVKIKIRPEAVPDRPREHRTDEKARNCVRESARVWTTSHGLAMDARFCKFSSNFVSATFFFIAPGQTLTRTQERWGISKILGNLTRFALEAFFSFFSFFSRHEKFPGKLYQIYFQTERKNK